MTTNNAAYLSGPSAKPLTIETAPHRYPDEDEIVIRTAVVAINQIDWKIQDSPWDDFDYPLLLGEDVAGTVVDVGSCVTKFKKGDRVIGHAVAFATNDERHAAFQDYVVLMENMAALIPSTLSFEKGVVLPLGVSTASAALFQPTALGLGRPSLNPVKNGETVLIWGGTTSVGSNAIQLALAAGYDVIATASEKNFQYVSKLGAFAVIDYKSKTVVPDLVAALRGRKLAGAFDTVGTADSIEATTAVVEQAAGKDVVASVSEEIGEIDLPDGVTGVYVQAVDIRENEVSEIIYGDYLPKALTAGKYETVPEPYVAGIGLQAIQGAFDAQKKVSARKVVVTIF